MTHAGRRTSETDDPRRTAVNRVPTVIVLIDNLWWPAAITV